MGYNVWGVGGIAPIFHNITGVGGLGTPDLEGLGISESLKTTLLLANNNISATGAEAFGLIMNLEL